MNALARTLLVLALGCAGCSGRHPRAKDAWSLYWNLARTHRVQVVAAEGPVRDVLRVAFRRLEKEGHYEAEYVRPDAVPDDPLAARIWIGDVATPGADRALRQLGVQSAGESGFQFLGHVYRGDNGALVATLEDPDRPGMPLTVYLGVVAERAARLAGDLAPAWRPGFRTYAFGELEREGRLALDGGAIPDSIVSLVEPRRAVFGKPRVEDCGPFDLITPPDFDAERTARWVEAARAALARVDELLGGEGSRQPEDKPRVRAWPRPEDKARLTRERSPSSIDPLTRQIEIVLSPELPDGGDGGFALARDRALALRGDPAAEWLLDGVAASALDTWWGRPMEEWIAFLAANGLAPSLEELAAPDGERSPHLLAPMRGALVRALGREEVLGLWSGSRRLDVAPESAASKRYGDWLAQRVDAHRSALEQARAAHLAEVLARPFRNGIDLCAPQGGTLALERGFGTRASAQSLERARSLGVDAVAIVARAWLAEDTPDSSGDAFERGSRASASDMALFATASQARELGMNVMLRPQLLACRSGDWAGAALLSTRENQERLFAGYRAFALHYALLAELAGAEILCIGSETPAATSTRPSEGNRRESEFLPLRREGWSSVIAVARKGFTGALTYSSRWDTELRGIEFWPELDFVGQNLFAPLCQPATPRTPPRPNDVPLRLAGEMLELGRVARELGKPALVVEVGCSSSSEAWKNPSRVAGPVDLDLQRAFYNALAPALARAAKGGAALSGAYVWCWSTDPRAGGGADRRFSVQNKPAEAALKRLFSAQ